MSDRQHLNQLQENIRKKKSELAYLSDQQKVIAKEAAQLNRRARTRRLCTRGGMLERFLRHPERLTDAEVMEVLRLAFTQPPVQRWLDVHVPNESKGD